MNRLWIIPIAIVGLMTVAIPQGHTQTMMEMDTAMRMQDTLQGTSSGITRMPEINLPGQSYGGGDPGVPGRGGRAAEASVDIYTETQPFTLKPPVVKEGDEGTPFSVSEASRWANEGMIHLRAMRFNEAKEAYRIASERDPQYETFYKKVAFLNNRVNQGKLADMKKRRVFQDKDITWAQYLGWDKGTDMMSGMMPGMMPGMMGMMGPGMMGPGMMGPGMMGPGMMGPGMGPGGETTPR